VRRRTAAEGEEVARQHEGWRCQGGPGGGPEPGSAARWRREDVGYVDPGKRGCPEVASDRALEELAACRHAERVEASRLGDAAGGQGGLHARALVLRIQVELEVSDAARREQQVESESFSGLTDR